MSHKIKKFSTKFDDLDVIIMGNRCSIQQSEESNCWLEQNPENLLYRLFRSFWATLYKRQWYVKTRRALLLHKVYGNSTLLVLKGTSLNSVNALLILRWCRWYMRVWKLYIGVLKDPCKCWESSYTLIWFTNTRRAYMYLNAWYDLKECTIHDM